MSELDTKIFSMYQNGDKIEVIAQKLGINEAFVRQVILRKAKSQ